MKRIPLRILALAVFLCSGFHAAVAGTPDSLQIPESFQKVLPEVVYENAELRDVLKALSVTGKVNIFVSPSVQGRASLRLYNQKLIDILNFIADQYKLTISWSGGIASVSIKALKELDFPQFLKPKIVLEDSRLSFDVQSVPTQVVIRELISVTKKNVITETSMPEMLNGYLAPLPVQEAITLFFRMNQVQARERNGIFYLQRNDQEVSSAGQMSRTGYWLEVKDSSINIDVQKTSIDRLIRDAAQQLNLSIFYYNDLAGTITAKANHLPFDSFLSFLLRNTTYTFKKEDGIYFLGERSNKSLETSKLLLLKNRKVEAITELFPPQLASQASIKILKEQNALMVSATQNVIEDVQSFIKTVDFSTPQVLIEALVIDFSSSDGISTGVSAGTRGSDTTKAGIGKSNSYLPGLDITMSAATLNRATSKLGIVNMFGTDVNLARIGKLPADFYLRVQALENAGLAKVRSRPMLSTLNGHKATLSVGTTQYYILKSTTPIRDNQGTVLTESQQFKEISANITLEVTPWVSSSGEVTVEIKPVFETPVGQFTSETPPTINKRSFESTIRLSDGETIVLGGLIEESESDVTEGIPYLSRIPYLGTFFSTKTKVKKKAELVIYVTPHVYFGAEVPKTYPDEK
ncbi:MAG: type II secretion system protein GspD [Bacteroidetes bacterium]|nr:type II secretion system protein GspD [Bacteroidota bacterium]